MQTEENGNRQKRAFHLLAIAGAVYIAFGLLELTAYLYQVSVDYLQLFLYTVIGIGLLGKHAWSRILGMTVSTFTLVIAFLAFIFYGKFIGRICL